MARYRLAILNSHPIQYFAPLYRRLALEPEIDLTVYYCSRQGLEAYADDGFGGHRVQWDIPLLEGYRCHFLPNRGSAMRLGGFWSLINPEIIDALRHYRYDALWVHGHNYGTYMMAYLAARLFGTPIFTRGETHLLLRRSVLKRALRRPLLALFYSQMAGCLAIGTRNAAFYRYHGVPEGKIFYVPYTVDNERFIAQADQKRRRRLAIRETLGISPNLPLVLFASKFTRRKRPMDLLRAKALLERVGKRFSLVYVGAGEQEERMRQFVAAERLPDVYFLGFRNQRELPDIYVMSDIFVLPSENEPWGLILNEVMCAGVAVVASEEIGGVSDLVRLGENGELFPARHVPALSNILGRLLGDPELTARMGRRSREIIQRWSYERCSDGVKAALASLGPARGDRVARPARR
jgi:glycosyltransferase involved in cell wall biosynthesis